MSVSNLSLAPIVCEPCKRRKKSCNKALPSCGRCSRLLVKCAYVYPNDEKQPAVLPPLGNAIPNTGLPTPPSNNVPLFYGPLENIFAKSAPSRSIEDQVSMQAHRLLDAVSRKKGYMHVFCETYFRNINPALPIINEEIFYWQLQNLTSDGHFSTLLLAILLVCQLDRRIAEEGEGMEELYGTLKSIFALLQSTGNGSVELVQAGALIASWEYCQGLLKDAWLTVGGCVRMGQLAGLHTTIKEVLPEDEEARKVLEARRCLWWGLVVLERVINVEYDDNKLPFATTPDPDGFLPLVPLDDGNSYRVRDDILLLENLDQLGTMLPVRGFTGFGPYSATIQAAYLSSLATQHVLDDRKDLATRKADSHKVETVLQSFVGALCPPPGGAAGSYCGGYGIRMSAMVFLHTKDLEYFTQRNDIEGVNRAKLALQSLTRITISLTHLAWSGVPMDWDKLSFWCHRSVGLVGLLHIKYGERNPEWQTDLDILKRYLRMIGPRMKLYDNYLRKIEEAEQADSHTR